MLENNSSKVVVFDLEGTLSLFEQRLHYVRKVPMDELAFYEAFSCDEPNKDIIRLTQMYASFGFQVVIMTSRFEDSRDITEEWLDRHDVYFDNLFMQTRGYRVPDHRFKKRCAEEIGLEYIHVAYDDRSPVASMWRTLGITCLVVADRPEYNLKKPRPRPETLGRIIVNKPGGNLHETR